VSIHHLDHHQHHHDLSGTHDNDDEHQYDHHEHIQHDADDLYDGGADHHHVASVWRGVPPLRRKLSRRDALR